MPRVASTGLAAEDYQCYGLAIVRAVDVASKHYLLLTPEPLATLEKVTHLVRGDSSMEVPIWCMVDGSVSVTMMSSQWKRKRKLVDNGSSEYGLKRQTPYLSYESNEGVGAGVLRPRRDIIR